MTPEQGTEYWLKRQQEAIKAYEYATEQLGRLAISEPVNADQAIPDVKGRDICFG